MSDNPIFSYTKRDYESSRKEGLAKIPELSNGVWTDLNATDPGIIILDYVHALVDMINFYQDHQALETFITTAKERENLFRLAKQLSYKIKSANSAKLLVTFKSDFYYQETIKIPKGTRVETNDSIIYITKEDAYLRLGESEVSVLCEQGTIYEKIYEGTGLSKYSNVEPPANVDQKVILTADNIDIDSIIIEDNLGRIWRSVDYIIFSKENERVYQKELNPDNSVTIKFGDGKRGVVPGETDVLNIKYLVTDAEKGQVGPNSVTRIVDDILDSKGRIVPLSVYNEEASVGGSSPQSSTSIRELAPGAIKAQDRAITLSDFENLAKLVDGVYDAKAYDINVNPDIPHNEVRVLVIPTDSNASSKVLIKQVYDYLYQRMIPPTNLQVSVPSIIPINLDITVKKLDNTDSGELEYAISRAVKNYFESKTREIGEDFYPIDLSTAISSVTNVKYVVSMTPNDIVPISDESIVGLGTLKITII